MSCLSNIYKVIDYVNYNLGKDSLIDICYNISDLSKEYFSKMFKLYIGFTLDEYIRKMRLKECAKQIFSVSDVYEIARKNGYKNFDDFKYEFIHEFGMEPSKYFNMSIKILKPFEDLTEIERIIAFYPAPNHKDAFGHLLYKEHKEIYDSLIEKGYFGKDLDMFLKQSRLQKNTIMIVNI